MQERNQLGGFVRVCRWAAMLATAILVGCGGSVDGAAGESDAIVSGRTDTLSVEELEWRERAGGSGRAPLLESSAGDPRTGIWTESMRTIVGKWIERARVSSKEVAHAGNIGFGLHVVDAASGLVLADIRADQARRPASNMKLVTTAAALVLFGPNAEFETTFEAAGEIEGGRLRGDLVIRASGDPIVNEDSDPRVEGRFREAARELHAAGLRVIEGDLVLDEGTFLDPAPGPAWPDPSQHWQEYCALAGGFSVNGGVLLATVTPTRPGEDAEVELHPVPHGMRSIIRPKTIAKGAMTIGGEARNGRVLVQGNIPSDRTPFDAEFSHADPVTHFGAILAWALEAEGIALEGAVRRRRNVPGGPRLTVMRSAVADTLFPINAESRNGVADQVFLALGHAIGFGGTRGGGQEATRRALTLLGVPTEELHQVDGSGLSFENEVAPLQITTLLAGALQLGRESRERFLASLAIAGRVGTLEERMVGTTAAGRVYGKSGWIRGTSALSGIAINQDGRHLVFSILIEYPPEVSGLNTSAFKPLQDELCVYMVEQVIPEPAGGGQADDE